jgi:hypothetical protein
MVELSPLWPMSIDVVVVFWRNSFGEHQALSIPASQL